MSLIKYQWSPRPAKFNKAKKPVMLRQAKATKNPSKPRRKWREFHKGQNASTCEIRHLHEIPQAEFAPVDLTSPRAGFSESEKSQLEEMNRELLTKQQRYFAENPTEPRPAGRHDSAGRHRLVKECKSPTKLRKVEEIAQKHKAFAKFEAFLADKGSPLAESIWQPEIRYQAQSVAMVKETPRLSRGWIDRETGEFRPFTSFENLTHDRTAVVAIQHRAWANQYRVRVEASASPSEPPPQQAGDRVTQALTPKASSKIIDAGAYVAAVRDGMTTFLTLTFDAAQREKLAAGEITIGSEVSRFFDAAQRIYQRGWSCRGKSLKEQDGFKCIGATARVEGYNEPLDYIWVAENPDNNNPHVHVLMRWKVEPWLFHDWAARIEKVWGRGIAHIERIKNPKAASNYLLKALGYFVKGEDGSQGEIIGNRYGISKSARAPAWETLETFHAEHMAAIIGEIKYKLERRERPTQRQLSKLNGQHAQAVKALSMFKAHKPDKAAAIKKHLKKLEAEIKRQAGFIRDRKQKVWACDFQLTITGREAFNKFMGWAVGARGWSAQMRDGVQVDTQVFTKKYSAVRQRFEDLQAWWQAVISDSAPKPLQQWQLLLLQRGEIAQETEQLDFNHYEQWAMEA